MKRECSIVKGKISCTKPEERIYSIDDVRSGNREIKTKKTYTLSRGLGAKENTKKAIDALGGMCKFVTKGDLVAIKANMTGGAPDLWQTFTDKEVLTEIVREVRECGGDPFIYDSSMVWTPLEPIAKKAQFMTLGKKLKIPIVNLTKENQIKFNFGSGSLIGTDKASQLIKESDVIINVPVAKTHIMTGITSALKNMYGTLPIMDKAKYHAKGINSVIAEVSKNFRPTLTVVDMVKGCEGGGPLVCRKTDPMPDTVIASTDPVCADAVAATIMGHRDLKSIRHLEEAEKIGVGSKACAEDVRKTLPMQTTKDFHWRIIEDDKGLAGFVTDLFEGIMKFPPMIPFTDIAADFWLGWLHYTFKNGMANFWDKVIDMSEAYNIKKGNYSDQKESL